VQPGNFVRDVVANGDGAAVLLIERALDGRRHEHTRAALLDRAARLATTLHQLGVRRGDLVLTIVGNRVEWVESMLACFGAGFVVLPCTEQFRAHDLQLRIGIAKPVVVIADVRNRALIEEADLNCPVLWLPDAAAYDADPTPYAELHPTDPALVIFTSGTSGPPKAVLHAQSYLTGQQLQATQWVGAETTDLVWCTASPGWSKSARNGFIAAWLRGARALIHDGRFDGKERLAIAAEESVTVWCMTPTEYRLIAAHTTIPAMPQLRTLLAAGEALDPETLRVWRAATGIEVRDGYGQTETGHLVGNHLGEPARAGSMGKPINGIDAWVEDGELVVDPATVPTFFLGYLGQEPPTGPWRTGDRVDTDADGYLYFQGRADDVIVSAGYRIGPFEVESVLAEHPAVAEAAVVAVADAERGEVVRAVVVLAPGAEASEALAQELQEHVKARTAPYKYPRIVDFVTELPKTASGKVRRSVLREGR
jgi:acyl-coenzyme A synthetase/AMP-(fatty) acid ligase